MSNYHFLESFTFERGLQLKNKIVMSPMTTMASFYNGMVSGDELNYYEARAGGPGMIITAVANVSASGKGFEGELSVESDEMISGLKKLATTLKSKGGKAILQIFHAGRKSNSKILRGEQPVSASAIAAEYPKASEIPRALTEDEIEEIILDFGAAVKRAIIAGFDGVELHGANTYLLQQFYSENANQRTDSWGGSRENRMKFPMAVISEVNQIIDEFANRPFILGYRISPEEIETPGIRLEDSLYFADKIKNHVDYIHLSMGSYKRTSLNDKADIIPILEKFSKVIANEVPLIGVGSVEKPREADEVLEYGADLVAIGRELLREPQWVQKAMAGDEASIRTKISPSDLAELKIPDIMQIYLKAAFNSVMHFTTDTNQVIDYQNEVAPMEGFEKKL
ncbi:MULTISPECIES: NADH-dependent flavin oxidoreductase [unclassified Enterococcus]|uniref:NADH-dependent flavin oxidoreductase n=1 Tax=unclassified Enterococcus TaxID=2608891 RepID=UPI00155598C2|nr:MULTISPECIES: NADH-dependent flavin oxidoreductase [unclassified Enterococcus]MBS7576091.1 NADH-dependent flavin oxidoreductase [Enterococcus sp. MMGLQ5-2]MBS7583324.1 NADH-dependent flavin oxidoreductase [Enterococcus sp. MMGLQ5-1]NPD11184.1 NADH-dependent flavin oxidoreductase [Enterococcus sp. MMGLQ5-1]NPD35927.1 NADH-dependent flavin oxidoreductase [Enterococcus sp. MMGLQ5-2]